MCLEEIDGDFYSHFNGDFTEGPATAAAEKTETNELVPSKKLNTAKKRKREDARKEDDGKVVPPKKLKDGKKRKKYDVKEEHEDKIKDKLIEGFPDKECHKNKKKRKESIIQTDDGVAGIERNTMEDTGESAFFFINMHSV